MLLAPKALQQDKSGPATQWEVHAQPACGALPGWGPGRPAQVSRQARPAAQAGLPNPRGGNHAACCYCCCGAGIDLPGLTPNVDYFNLMAYDYGFDPEAGWGNTTVIHTPWEAQVGGGLWLGCADRQMPALGARR